MKNTLNVYLKGSRDYIQGTQIIARLSELLPENQDFYLEYANFNKITDKGIFYIESTNVSSLKINELGSIAFKSDSLKKIKKYFFYEDKGNKALVIDDIPINYNYSINSYEGLSANINLKTKNNFESILECIVYFVKKIHIEHKKNVSNVWFSALNKANIPIVKSKEVLEVNLNIKNIINKKINEKFLTMSIVNFKSSSHNFSLNIAFAYDLL